MQGVVVVGVEDREEDDSGSAKRAECDRSDRQSLLALGGVGDEESIMSKIALDEEGRVEARHHYGRHGDEQRLETECASIRDVCNGLSIIHRCEAGSAINYPCEEQGEEHGKPDKSPNNGQYCGIAPHADNYCGVC